MAPRYGTPRELIDALHRRAPQARAQICDWLRPALERLFRELKARCPSGHDHEVVTLYALHAAETYLRTRPPETVARLSWHAIRAAVLLYLAKLATQPYGGSTGLGGPPGSLPEDGVYRSRALFLPFERVGNYWYGGDWYTGLRAPDGALWVLVADITGHGYYAYLLATGLPGVWQASWQKTLPRQPADLLAAMHDLLEDCLPEGVYVECTLARCGPEGEVTLAPAGGSRHLLHRQGAAVTEIVKLRSLWLGLGRPSTREQRTLQLDPGDQLLLTTDGVFEHLPEGEGAMALEALAAATPGQSLFDGVRRLLQEALARGPQKDDITMVLLSRQSATQAVAAVPAISGEKER